MSPALRRKLAILGSTYARALSNAATRGGQALSPAMSNKLTAMQAQPQAKLQPGLGQMFREHSAGGALTPTPQQQNLQQMLHQTPWATDEHTGLRGGSEHAVARYNQLLDESGRSHATPAGQPTTHQRIQQSFGAAHPQMKDPSQVRPMPPGTYRLPGGFSAPVGRNPFELMDDTGRGNTHVGPAPVPQQPRPVAHTPSSVASTAVLRKTGAALPLAAGIGIPLAIGGGLLASKPGIRANMRALSEGGSTKERDVAGGLPEPALNQANAIHSALTAHGLDPATIRMGIDAPPGSGKTTLARALAQQAGMKHYGLDWEPGNWWKSTIGLGRNVESMPRAPKAGEVLEHYMLGRTYDPELFDAMVHIHRDPNVLRQQLQHRGHGAYIGDLMDLDKSLGVADLGFETLGGETVDLGDGVQLKMRPREGWGNVLDQRLMQLGIDPTNMSRHEKLLSLHAGKRQSGAGWTPYVKSPFSGAETAAIGASIPLGIMAAKALAKHGADTEKDAGVLDALRRAGSGIRNQYNNLNMHVGQAMSAADPHATLNPTLPVPGVGAATTGAINYLSSKIPGRAGNLAAKGIDAAMPSMNPQGFGAGKLISHAVNTLAPNIGPAGTALTHGLVHGVPAALRRVAPAVAPHAGTLLKETL